MNLPNLLSLIVRNLDVSSEELSHLTLCEAAIVSDICFALTRVNESSEFANVLRAIFDRLDPVLFDVETASEAGILNSIHDIGE